MLRRSQFDLTAAMKRFVKADKEQSKGFIEMARAIEADEKKSRADELLRLLHRRTYRGRARRKA